MKLKDILPEYEIDIEYRTNSPFENEEDTLFGWCHWTGTELCSLDGDSYSIEDIIERYELTDHLTIWFLSTYMHGETE